MTVCHSSWVAWRQGGQEGVTSCRLGMVACYKLVGIPASRACLPPLQLADLRHGTSGMLFWNMDQISC